MILKGTLLVTGSLLCIQHITSFASLVRAGTCVESSLQSEHFPALSALASWANTSDRSNRNNNNNPATGYFEQNADTYVDSPIEPANAASKLDSTLLDHAPSSTPITHTAIIEPVHHIA